MSLLSLASNHHLLLIIPPHRHVDSVVLFRPAPKSQATVSPLLSISSPSISLTLSTQNRQGTAPVLQTCTSIVSLSLQHAQHPQILSELMAAPSLPSHLPPSPPPSRSASPLPSVNGRRKLPPDAPDGHAVKVARTSLYHSDVHQDARNLEEGPVASTSTAAVPLPVVTAPTPGGPDPSPFVYRRGRPTPSDFIRFHERYSTHGKFLKTSSEQRSQKEPATSNQNTPHSSAYAAHWQLFSRFEALDALLHFTYAMWCKDMSDGKTHHSLWDTIDLYLKWVRGRWETSETKGALMSTFTGLMCVFDTSHPSLRRR